MKARSKAAEIEPVFLAAAALQADFAVAAKQWPVLAKIRRYGWLFVDQAVFALTNLVLNLLFAHWLTPAEYGRFGVTFSGFILLSVLHWFVVIEPMLVESARICPEQVRAYVGTIARAHLLLLAVACIVAVTADGFATIIGWENVAPAVAAISIGGCSLLTLATARRLCLTFLSAAASALVGGCYLLAATASAWLLHYAGLTSWLALWCVMAVWSLACAGAIVALLLTGHRATQPYGLRDLWRATRRYVAWGSVSAVFSWMRSDGIYAVLAATGGLTAVAQTRAIVTLNAPVPQLNSALNISWLIDFGRRRGNTSDLRRTVVRRAGLYAVVSIVAVAVSIGVARFVTHLAYGGKYDAGAWLMPLFLIAYLLNGLEGMLTSAMKASGIVDQAYWPQMIGSVAVGGVAVWLVPSLGPQAAALAVLVGSAIGLASAIVLFRRGGQPNG